MADEPIPIDQPVPPPEPDDEAEPEGVVDVPGRGRLVDVSVVAAERRRVRATVERQVREREVAPLKAEAEEAGRLRHALTEAQHYVDLVKQHPEILTPPPAQPAEAAVSDQEALVEAQELELYSPNTGEPDLPRAKRIIAKRRTETAEAAKAAAEAAIGPTRAASAEQLSRQNFVAMAQLRGRDGELLVDPTILAEEWVKLDPAVTADQDVAETVLDRAIGRMHRAGPARQPAPNRTYSEAPGGPSDRGAPRLTNLDKKLGLTEKDLAETSKRFNPGGISQIGE